MDEANLFAAARAAKPPAKSKMLQLFLLLMLFKGASIDFAATTAKEGNCQVRVNTRRMQDTGATYSKGV